MPTAYQIIKAKAEQLGWPEAYRTDLTVHDRAMLRKAKPTRFVWILRSCGTWLFYPEHLTAEVGRAWFDAIVTSSAGEGALFYAYLIDQLVLIDRTRAAEFLADPQPDLTAYAIPANLRPAMERTPKTTLQLRLAMA